MTPLKPQIAIDCVIALINYAEDKEEQLEKQIEQLKRQVENQSLILEKEQRAANSNKFKGCSE